VSMWICWHNGNKNLDFETNMNLSKTRAQPKVGASESCVEVGSKVKEADILFLSCVGRRETS